MNLTDSLVYIGVNDHITDLFEGQFPVPDGISYNSHVLLDDKIAVIDTADDRFVDEWLCNLESALQGRSPSYLLVEHMEPDHSAGIRRFAAEWPEAVIVASKKAFDMMDNFYGESFDGRRRIVTDGDTLSLGRHELCFVAAPMVHWPEVMMIYDRTDRTLFSADGFGRFGALDREVAWDDEAARYYFGIVGKFGAQVQAVLKKAATLPIDRICPLHGPMLEGDAIQNALRLYDTWSSYRPEKRAVMIAYTSVYGHTKEVVEELKAMLNGEVTVWDLSRCDMTAAIAEAFRSDAVVLATTTYNMDIFPPMRAFLRGLSARQYQSRSVSLIENGSWAPMAAAVMRRMLEKCRDLTVDEDTVTVRGSLNTLSREKLRALAARLNERV
ncbi:MAG: FprA family A-type flavoprotein [Clostridia bacterium]|nr:FprA family A-type flavoprotein [Clostridia bacterium]